MGEVIPNVAAGATFAFGSYTLDTGALTLTSQGDLVPLEPQTFDVLHYLIAHRERVVSKEELLDNVWGDRFVSESALTTRIKSCRKAVNDSGKQQHSIRTVHGRGYQFVADVALVVADVASDPRPIEFSGAPVAPRIMAPAKALIDRIDLSAHLEERVVAGRLVTMVGPAGVGKTHLAQHVAARVADRFPDGSWFVPLAQVRDPDALGEAVLEAVGQTRFPSGTAIETLVDTIGQRSTLLVLDNCEHLLPAVAALISELLRAGDGLTVLATSRQRVGLPGERLVLVPVLDGEYGVQLFSERAAEHGVEVAADATLVAEVCAALDQLPLALELACAQSRTLGVKHLASLLDQRLDLLATTHEHDSHHQTLHGAIAASVDVLEEELRQTLYRFSQFPGPFDLNAGSAVAIAGRDLREIDAVRHTVELAERSLIEVDLGGGTARYRLLESIRLFGEANLTTPVETRVAYVEFYRTRAAALASALNGPDFETAWEAIRDDWTNFRHAVRVALELDRHDDALRIVNATVQYAEVASRYEHAEWAAQVLASTPDLDQPQAKLALAGRARLVSFKGDLDELRSLVAAGGDATESLSSAFAHFWLAGIEGDAPRVAAIATEIDRRSAGTGGLRELTNAAVANLASRRTEFDPTNASIRAKEIGRSSGPVGRTYALMVEALEARRDNDVEVALAACSEWAETARSSGLEIMASQAFGLRVSLVIDHDDHARIMKYVIEALEHYRSRGQWVAFRNDALVAARMLADCDVPEAAAVVFGGARAVRYRGPQLSYIDAIESDVRSALGDQADEALARSDGWGDDEFCDYALGELRALGS